MTEVGTAETTSTADFAVTGLTCRSCAARVSAAVSTLDGIEGVKLDLVAGGTSTLSISSRTPLRDADVVTAVEQAGYQIARSTAL